MYINKILKKVVANHAELFDADVAKVDTSTHNLRGAESKYQTTGILPTSKVEPATDKVQCHEYKKSADAQLDEMQGTNAENCNEYKKPRRLELPPNLYDEEGFIESFFGRLSYRHIFKHTSKKLVIHNDGGRQVPCTKCSIKHEYRLGMIGKNMMKAACSDCRRNPLTYLGWANEKACKFRHELYQKGLLEFVEHDLSLGFDDEKKLLIFPLNKNQYVTLPFDGRDYLLSKAESLPVLLHYNRLLKQDKADGIFKPLFHNANVDANVPYLDNRFFGVNGEIVIAECAAFSDGGRKWQAQGKLILPFPIK